MHFPFFPSWQMPSPFGVGPAHEKKIGHRRVDASGETTYKKVSFFLFICLSVCLRFLYLTPSVGFFCITISPTISHPHLTLLFSSLFSASRPPPLPCKGPSSWVLDILLATSAPSLREMCWCRTSTWWKASSFPGVFSEGLLLFLMCACVSHFF